jgi:serine O-acetyltransferase
MGASDSNPTSPSHLASALEALADSYSKSTVGARIGRRPLPSREAIIGILELAFELFYPGIYGRHDLDETRVREHLATQLASFQTQLADQIELALGFQSDGLPAESAHAIRVSPRAQNLADTLVGRLPTLRALLLEDVQAAYDGDPAATCLDEVVLAYPGLRAVTVHRIAHELYAMGVPLLPRMMSEWAHGETGADIHPGAQIGRSFFVDHATGVVVGETARIGDHVKLYQGVTLGALSHPRDAQGRVIRDTRRHPTVEDGATLYANATVLGGSTVVGADSIVGGSVFLTKTIPRRARVALKPPELRVVASDGMGSDEYPMEFEI